MFRARNDILGNANKESNDNVDTVPRREQRVAKKEIGIEPSVSLPMRILKQNYLAFRRYC